MKHIKASNPGELFAALAILFILTMVVYNFDPIYNGFLQNYVTTMGGSQEIYNSSMRNWRLVVPGFILIVILLIIRSFKTPNYGSYTR